MTYFPLTSIISSNIEAAGYDEATREGRIKFKDRTLKDGTVRPGATYVYYDAPTEIFRGMLSANANRVSPSKYLDQLRQRNVRYEKLSEIPEPHLEPTLPENNSSAVPIEDAVRMLHQDLEHMPEYGGSIQVTEGSLEVRLAQNTATSPAIRQLLRHGYLGYPVIGAAFED